MGLSDELGSLFQLSGMTPLTEQEGIAAFENILRGGRTQVLVATGDEERIARTLQVHRTQTAPSEMRTPARPVEMLVHTSTADTLQRRAEQWVKERVAVVVKATASTLDAERSFEQLGMDSVMMMELRDSLAKDFGDLPKTVLFEYETPARLVQYLLLKHQAAALARFGASALVAVNDDSSTVRAQAARAVSALTSVPPRTRSLASTQPPASRAKKKSSVAAASVEKDSVAIVGIAGQFPNAADLHQFWDNVRTGRDCLGEIPADRWDSRSGRVTCARGGFLTDVDRFDPGLFRMSLAEAEKSDPQLRVLLRAAWQALEDAAYTPGSLAGSRVGVYMGAMNEDFTWIVSDAYSRTGEYAGPGSMVSELANRVSFLMNFRGPSLTVATACASSLTAVHLARRAILDGECDVALAGAVNLSLHPSKYFMLTDMKVLSPNGEERTFDDAANGFVPSEGAGVVVLKRLSRALQDGDQIYGVIRGSCVSHSGTGAGQYLPNIHVVEETVARCLRESGIRPRDLTYIESHGTGTALGDPIELKGLANGLRQFTGDENFCAIGTRANLGHMESASGLCALIKVLLAMKHRELAPCAKLDAVNTSFALEGSPFHFPRAAQAWSQAPGQALVAGVNSFGMGGSNAFMIVESFTRAAVSVQAEPQEPSIVVLSARSEERVRAYLSKMIEFLERPEQQGMTPEDFANLAYSSQVGRIGFEHRLAIVAEDRSAWLAQARAYLESGRATQDVLIGNGRSADSLTAVFAGAEGHAFVEALINSRQWHKIAAIWARGGEIDWASLHVGRARRRVSFPSYPFESVRCDIRGAHATKIALPRIAADSSTAQAVTAEWFDLPSDLLGQKVLPGDFHQIETLEEWARQYWLDHLTETSDTNRSLAPLLALDPAEPIDDMPAVQCVSDVLGGALIASLQRCTQTHRIEVETLIVAAWAILMNRYTKARCSQFGVLRSLAPMENLKTPIRCEQLRNLVPVRIRTVTREKIAQWLENLQDSLNHTHVYGHIPLQRIEGWLGADNLFDSVVVFEKTGQPRSKAAHGLNRAGQRLLASEIFASQTRVAMELTATIHSDAVELDVLYRSGGLAQSKIETLLEHFKVLLEGLATHPHRNVAALPMRTPIESREALWKTLERVNH
jgi:polyketide synthase PksN